jgi:hypothetical protein
MRMAMLRGVCGHWTEYILDKIMGCISKSLDLSLTIHCLIVSTQTHFWHTPATVGVGPQLEAPSCAFLQCPSFLKIHNTPQTPAGVPTK